MGYFNDFTYLPIEISETYVQHFVIPSFEKSDEGDGLVTFSDHNRGRF